MTTTLTWRQQAEAAFRSALDGVRRTTGSMTAGHMTALGCALSVAEPLIREDERRRVLSEFADPEQGLGLIKLARADATMAERQRWHAVLAAGCAFRCDDDCENGPVHCEWLHEPNHKGGWHGEQDCPLAGLIEGRP